jgi:transposase
MQTTSQLIHEVLGPDVEMAVWNGAVLPYDAVYERRISNANTYDWWLKAHRQSVKEVRDYKNFASMIDYHTRFRGYCPRCQKGG